MSSTIISPLLLSFIFLLALSLFFKKMKTRTAIRTNLPPSPSKLPIIGNLHQLGKLPHQSLWELSQKYGPAMFLQLGSIPTLVISSADFAKEILKDHDTNFCTRPRSPGTNMIFYGCLDVAFSPYGDHWRNSRKIFVSTLLGSKRNESFLSTREREIGNLLNSLSAASPDPVNLDEKIYDFVDGVMGTVAFGKSYRGKQLEGRVLNDFLVEVMNVIDSFSAADFFPSFGWIIDLLNGHKARMEKCSRKLDGYFEMVLNEHLNRESARDCDDGDLVDALIGLSKDDDSVVLSKEHIKAMFVNTFLGGVDTAAITIIWAMSELIRNPGILHKAQAEIRGKLGVKAKVEADDLAKLTYLKMIVKETLRSHPPLPLLIPRESMSMCQIRGENGEVYDIYPKTRVLINAWAIGRNPKNWEYPNNFYPERFEGNDVDFRGHNFEFLPFGGGRRLCPGINNSIATIEYTLANLLYWFDWKVPNDMKVEDVASLEEEGGLTVHKKTHLTLVPVKCEWH